MQFSPNGSLLTGSCGDHTIRLWNSQTGQPIHILHAYNDWIRALNFSADGKMLASGGQDLIVNPWNVHTGACLRTWQDFKSWVWG
ncbi:hypothetical protein H6F87_07000 [Cyanobacteria bacterium FACHB-502]|nr:hypothetical protein [Cyanobacteria bacterium FACHB-502]MBD2025709.1 hypothetical protein [Leptolyngbya sp. FACHB-711]